MLFASGSNAITISDQEVKFNIEILTKLNASDASAPSNPPANAKRTTRARNEVMIENLEKAERAQRTDSRWRFATAAYIVIMAPMTAPSPEEDGDDRSEAGA